MRVCVDDIRDKVGNTNAVDASTQPVAEFDHAGEDHVSTIRSASNDHAILVQVFSARDPIQQCANVLDRVFSLVAIVEVEVALAIA